MSLTELMPVLKELSKRDKIRVIQLLVEELADLEEIPYLKAGKTYEIWSPYDAYEAAGVLRRMLEQEKEQS